MQKHRIVVIAALVAALGAPATAQNREHQQLAAESRMTQEQLQQLALSLTTLSQSLAEAVKALNARLDAAGETTRKGFADQKLLVDNLSNDVRVVREGSEDSNVRIRALTDELEALRSTLLAMQQAQAAAAAAQAPVVPVDPNAPAPIAPAPAPAISVPSTAGLSPARMFQEAQADYFAGQYAAAIAGFEAFVRAFPRVELSDDAYFHIGESQFAQNRWGEAIAAYNQVIQNYAGTNTVAEAYYKRGLAQERDGQVEAARASWEALIKTAPDSAAAQLAKQGLDRINRAQQR